MLGLVVMGAVRIRCRRSRAVGSHVLSLIGCRGARGPRGVASSYIGAFVGSGIGGGSGRAANSGLRKSGWETGVTGSYCGEVSGDYVESNQHFQRTETESRIHTGDST